MTDTQALATARSARRGFRSLEAFIAFAIVVVILVAGAAIVVRHAARVPASSIGSVVRGVNADSASGYASAGITTGLNADSATGYGATDTIVSRGLNADSRSGYRAPAAVPAATHLRQS